VFATLAVMPRLFRTVVLGANCSVTPCGVPVIAMPTAALNPFEGVSVSVVDAEPPGAAVIVVGAAVSVNPAGATTVSENVAVVETVPLVPLIVIE
jgi:hypothetical protein